MRYYGRARPKTIQGSFLFFALHTRATVVLWTRAPEKNPGGICGSSGAAGLDPKKANVEK